MQENTAEKFNVPTDFSSIGKNNSPHISPAFKNFVFLLIVVGAVVLGYLFIFKNDLGGPLTEKERAKLIDKIKAESNPVLSETEHQAVIEDIKLQSNPVLSSEERAAILQNMQASQ